jgi:hypothetical protein
LVLGEGIVCNISLFGFCLLGATKTAFRCVTRSIIVIRPGTGKLVRMNVLRFLFAAMGFCLLAACGGGGSHPGVVATSTPSAPRNPIANSGTTDASVGWDAPTSDGGAVIQSYELEVTPAIPPANIIITGTHALLLNLSLGTSYGVVIRARNSAGLGLASSTAIVRPQSVSAADYRALPIAGDTSPSGVFDPSVLRLANGDIWMSYSSVNYYNNASSQLVQDVGIRLARSVDGGATFNYAATIASPSNTTVTDAGMTACGVLTCQGRWVYETSWLIDDSTDPDPARRYKLFAHKYFLSPGKVPATFYHLGSIVMWTASAPDATWSAETSLLGWNLTPPQLTPQRIVNSLHTDLAPCIVVAEGSASVRGSAIDFVFACVYGGGNPLPQKIVMLRSLDHANSFQYVSTLLTPTDAAPISASHFSAPAILSTPGTAPVLLVTPVINGFYSGCIVIPFADDAVGQLFRVNSLPVGILYTPVLNVVGGACTYDRGLGARGILMNNVIQGATVVQTQFRIYATQAVLQP